MIKEALANIYEANIDGAPEKVKKESFEILRNFMFQMKVKDTFSQQEVTQISDIYNLIPIIQHPNIYRAFVSNFAEFNDVFLKIRKIIDSKETHYQTL